MVKHFKQEQEDDGAALVRTRTPAQDTAMELLRACSRQLSTGSLDRDGVRRLLLSAKYRQEYAGHFTVALSLSEAATVRRIMPLRSQKLSLMADADNDSAASNETSF